MQTFCFYLAVLIYFFYIYNVPRWYFAVISVSGVFAVTFSVVFAYVADITQEHERSMAYGLVCIFLALFLWHSGLKASVGRAFQNCGFISSGASQS